MAQQEFGIDLKTLSSTHKRIYDTQEHFLKMYARCGTILSDAWMVAAVWIWSDSVGGVGGGRGVLSDGGISGG